MARFEAKKLGYLAAVAAVVTLIAVQGCSSDDTQAQPTAGAGGKVNGGAGGKVEGGGAGGKISNGGAGNVGGDAGTGATGDTGGTSPGEGGAGGEGGAVSCDGEDGCYSCTPTTNTQLLNHCVPGGCPATFDNNTLTKLNLVGTL